MTKPNGNILGKQEVRFWMAIIAIVVTGAVAFANLKSQVAANETSTQEKGAKLREEFETDSMMLHEVHESVIRLEANQVLIMRSFNLTPVE